MKKKIVDIVCLSLIGLLILVVALLNIFQKDRPTVSESEKRTLAEFPEVSAKTVLDGSFFEGFDSFISDTFVFREELIGFAKKLELTYGFSTADSMTVIKGKEREEPTDETLVIPTLPIEDPTEETSAPTEVPSGTEIPSEPATSANTEFMPVVLEAFAFEKEMYELELSDITTVKLVMKPADLDLSGLTVTSSNPKVVEVTLTDEGVKLNAKKGGSVTVTASYLDQYSCQCIVSVFVPEENPDETEDPNRPDFIADEYILYQGAVYTIPYYSSKGAKAYGEVMDYYAKLFPNARITSVVAPLSSVVLPLNTFGKGVLTDQNDIINKDSSWFPESAHLVNPYSYIMEHKDEFLYFKSDHHWTARGAYYTYCAFCDYVGLTPTPIEDMKEVVINSSWRGSMYSVTKDSRIYKITDTVYAYLPTKAHTMKIYENGETESYNSCISTHYTSYLAFLTGDRAYIVINVPDNPQDFNCLVYGDSFGNAFVPYLCEHYGNIIVVDPRYCTFNVYDLLKDYPLADIIFVNNIYNSNNNSWPRSLLKCVTR